MITSYNTGVSLSIHTIVYKVNTDTNTLSERTVLPTNHSASWLVICMAHSCMHLSFFSSPDRGWSSLLDLSSSLILQQSNAQRQHCRYSCNRRSIFRHRTMVHSANVNSSHMCESLAIASYPIYRDQKQKIVVKFQLFCHWY